MSYMPWRRTRVTADGTIRIEGEMVAVQAKTGREDILHYMQNMCDPVWLDHPMGWGQLLRAPRSPFYGEGSYEKVSNTAVQENNPISHPNGLILQAEMDVRNPRKERSLIQA